MRRTSEGNVRNGLVSSPTAFIMRARLSDGRHSGAMSKTVKVCKGVGSGNYPVQQASVGNDAIEERLVVFHQTCIYGASGAIFEVQQNVFGPDLNPLDF